jgi:hypothetical protein
MSGKSTALILRQMHPVMINEAEKYDLIIDFPSWFSSLSLNEKSVPYTVQKSLEAEKNIKLADLKKSTTKEFNMSYSEYNNIDQEVVNTVKDVIQTVDIFSHLYDQNNGRKKSRAKKSDY